MPEIRRIPRANGTQNILYVSNPESPTAMMQTAIPLNTGLLHFIGIGGIGMSGIAEILHNLGYQVQGSDMADSANVKRLRTLGITVHIGHGVNNLGDARVVIVSTAIKASNPELLAAKALRLPIVKRADMLAELVRLKGSVAIAGTHGKTTTTTMVATLLEAGNLDPTVINGGIVNAYGTNTRMGKGEWIVVEADESDGTFLKLRPTIGIVTNIDAEHLDHYGSFDALKTAFRQFLEGLPFYGFGVVCLDHPVIQGIIADIADRRIITYGASPQADLRALNITMHPTGACFDLKVGERIMENMRMPMLGEHNVWNALAAIAVALELGLDEQQLRKGLSQFTGVKRRFTQVANVDGITIIDDYGHHPVEIAAVLKTARQVCRGRLIAVAQPHRFTRLRDLWNEFSSCFHDADSVIVLPVYTAGEDPIEGITHQALAASIMDHGHKHVLALDDPADLAATIGGIAGAQDYVVCLGAGNITAMAYALPEQLTPLLAKRA